MGLSHPAAFALCVNAVFRLDVMSRDQVGRHKVLPFHNADTPDVTCCYFAAARAYRYGKCQFARQDETTVFKFAPLTKLHANAETKWDNCAARASLRSSKDLWCARNHTSRPDITSNDIEMQNIHVTPKTELHPPCLPQNVKARSAPSRPTPPKLGSYQIITSCGEQTQPARSR